MYKFLKLYIPLNYKTPYFPVLSCPQYWSVSYTHLKTTVFIQNINKVRKGIGKKYLHSGQMLRPFALRCSHAPNRYPMENRDDISVPALLTGCFQASDGTIGQVVVNYNDEAVSFGLEVPPAYRCTCLLYTSRCV